MGVFFAVNIFYLDYIFALSNSLLLRFTDDTFDPELSATIGLKHKHTGNIFHTKTRGHSQGLLFNVNSL